MTQESNRASKAEPAAAPTATGPIGVKEIETLIKKLAIDTDMLADESGPSLEVEGEQY